METFAIDTNDVREAVRAALASIDLRALVTAEADRVTRIERERLQQENERQARDRNAVALIAQSVLMQAAARLGPVQLRYTSDAAPEALRWVPALPPGAVRR